MGLKPRISKKADSLEEETSFLNVDLELAAAFDLTPLAKALGRVFVLHQTSEAPFVLHLEVEAGPLDFADTMAALLDLVESLDAAGRKLWDQCTQRRFDIGIQSGIEPHSSAFLLPQKTLSRLAAIGAEVNLTIYGTKLGVAAS